MAKTQAFDPDAYLREPLPAPKAPTADFDPDAYLAQPTSPTVFDDIKNAYNDVGGISGIAQKAGEYLQPLSNAADKVTATMPFAGAVVNPALGMAQYAGAKINEAAGGLAEPVTERLGEHGVPGPAAAAVGMAASIAANPMTWMNPAGAGIAGKVFRPVVPIERQAAVSAAEDIGLPMRRGEQTGSKFSLGLSNLMEKTPLGSGPEEAFTARQYAKLGEEKARLQGAMGTGQDTFAAGLKSKSNVPVRESAMSATRQEMFDKIPSDVYIPLDEYKNIGDTILQEQSQVRPIARNAEVSRFAEDAQKLYGSTGEGVTGGPEYKGIARRSKLLPDYKPGTMTEPHAVFQGNTDWGEGNISSQYIVRGNHPRAGGNFGAAQIKEMGIPVVGAEGKGIGQVHDLNTSPMEPHIQASVGPEESFAPKSNYQDIKALRETLTGKITEAHEAGNFQTERHFVRLKSALDKDINKYVEGQTSPLDSMVAQEFSQTYKKANAFSGAFKNLFKSGDAKAIAETPPEHIIKSIFTPNNETAIKQFRAMAGEEGFAPIKQKFTQDLLESGNVSKEIEKLKGSANAIYTPAELEQIKRYGLAQTIPKSVPNLQGTQGSARMNVHAASYAGLMTGIGELFRGDIIGGAAGIGQFFAPAAISRANLATAGGVPYSLGAKSVGAIRPAATATSSTKQDLHKEFVRRFIKLVQ